MNIFAGNIFLKESRKPPELDLDIIQISQKGFFVMWAEEGVRSFYDLEAFLEEHFGEIDSYDISLEWEDEIEIILDETDGTRYECVTFEWPSLDFGEILERFLDSEGVICVREVESSNKYGNRNIRVDFMY